MKSGRRDMAREMLGPGNSGHNYRDRFPQIKAATTDATDPLALKRGKLKTSAGARWDRAKSLGEPLPCDLHSRRTLGGGGNQLVDRLSQLPQRDRHDEHLAAVVHLDLTPPGAVRNIEQEDCR